MSAVPIAVERTAVRPEIALVPGRRAAVDLEVFEPRTRRKIRVPRVLSRMSGVVAVVLFWQLLSSTRSIPSTIVGSPGAVARVGWQLTASGQLGSAIAASLERVAIGVVFGLAIGITLAMISGLSRLGEDFVDAPVQMLRLVPFAGIIPLFIIWLGVGQTEKVAVIALGTLFPMYINLSGGIRSVDPALVEAGRTLGLSKVGLVRHVVLPSALPQMLVGLRMSLGVSWIALVFAEEVAATNGLGFLMMSAQELLQTNVIVVCLVVYAVLGLTVDLVVRALEKVLLTWRKGG